MPNLPFWAPARGHGHSQPQVRLTAADLDVVLGAGLSKLGEPAGGITRQKASMRFATLKPRVGQLRKPGLQTSAVRAARATGGEWANARHRILTRDFGVCQCAMCIRHGQLRPAHEVDHVVPLWAGGAESDSNRAAINRECHKAKTAAEAAMRAAGAFDPEPWALPTLMRINPPDTR